MFNVKTYYEKYEIDKFIEYGLAIRLDCCGIIKGVSHAEGGINLIRELKNRFYTIATVEGFEFISGGRPDIEELHDEINNYDDDFYYGFQSYEIPNGIKIIDTMLKEAFVWKSKPIIIPNETYCIINKYSTKKHIEKLAQLCR